MKEHLGLFYSLRKTLLLGLLLFPFLGGVKMEAQTFKRYFRNFHTSNPYHFTVSDLDLNPAFERIVISGSFRADSTSNEALGYVMETGMDGIEVKGHSLRVPSFNSHDGFHLGGLAMDEFDRSYIAGSYADNLGQPSSTNEKTISGLESDGKLRWSKMEGSRHFQDIVYDADDQSLIAVGAPDGPWPGTQPLAAVKVDLEGKTLAYKSLYDPTISKSVKIIDLPDNRGYFLVALYDTAGLKAPYVVYLSPSLKVQWSVIYTDFVREYEVFDASFHPDGVLGISGSSYDPITEETYAFLMGVTPGAKLNFCHRFKVPKQEKTQGFGLSYVQHPDYPSLDGFVIGGAYSPLLSSVRRQSMVIHTDLHGRPTYVWDYSALPEQDFEQDEVARRVLFLKDRNMFVVAGEYASFFQGKQLERQIWMAKVKIRDGELLDGGSCSAPLSLVMKQDQLSPYKAGEDTVGGGLQNFTYATGEVFFTGESCSYDATPDVLRLNSVDPIKLKAEAEKIEVLDLSGRLLLSVSVQDQNWREGLRPGFYLLKYSKGNQILGAEKIVIRP